MNVTFLDNEMKLLCKKSILFLNCKSDCLNYFKIDFNFQIAFVTFENYGYYFLKYDSKSLKIIKELEQYP